MPIFNIISFFEPSQSFIITFPLEKNYWKTVFQTVISLFPTELLHIIFSANDGHLIADYIEYKGHYVEIACITILTVPFVLLTSYGMIEKARFINPNRRPFSRKICLQTISLPIVFDSVWYKASDSDNSQIHSDWSASMIWKPWPYADWDNLKTCLSSWF